MISYSVYKVMHLTGVLMVFMSLGGASLLANGAGMKALRRPVFATHGIGLVFSLVGGFGLLARLGVMHGQMPGWAVAKLVIWVVLAAMIGIFMRLPSRMSALWLLTIGLGSAAAYVAGYKPF